VLCTLTVLCGDICSLFGNSLVCVSPKVFVLHLCSLLSLKDAQEVFNIKIEAPKTPTTTGSLLSPPPRPGIGDTWLEVDESFSEQLVSIEPAEGETCSNSSYSDSPRGSLASLNSQRGSRGSVGGLR